jgi:hypothetical protein
MCFPEASVRSANGGNRRDEISNGSSLLTPQILRISQLSASWVDEQRLAHGHSPIPRAQLLGRLIATSFRGEYADFIFSSFSTDHLQFTDCRPSSETIAQFWTQRLFFPVRSGR